MHPIKKSLKLSRNHGQKLEKASASALDDSMDDFIVTRPLRAERKAAKNKPVSKLVFDQQQEANKNNQDLSSPGYSNDISRDSGSTSRKTADSSAKTLSDSEQNETHRSEYALPSVSQETFRNLQNKEISQSTSPKLSFDQNKKTVEKRRTTRRRAVDPSDLSLALALSESLQSANESARKQEEELLLTENLAEVISDLRNEEQTTGVLSHVFQKPVDAPITKVKRKARVAFKNKEPTQYTLALRSQAERERLIADRAASILNQEPDDPLRPPKKCFNHSQPVSEYIKQYFKDDLPLWQRASLSDITSLDESDAFYVRALRSVLSPPKKKDGYTNILLRVSQLPGRNSSQVDISGISNTQQLLEELAFAADGGFVEDPNVQDEHHVVSDSVVASVNRLTQDWSNFLDNPNMSDVIIRTKDKNIWAHRLVFAARFPKILDSVKDATPSEKSNLDWSSFSAAAAMKVLRFIYAAAYEHDNEDARQVYRLARRYRMSELIELLPRQCERDSESSGESDSTLELDLTKRISPKSSGKKLLHESQKSPEMVIIKEKIGTQEKRKLYFNSQKKNSPPSSFLSTSIKSTKLFHDDQEECSIIENLDETRETKGHDGSCVTRKVEEISLQCSTLENRRPISCAMSASDMDICSSNNTPNNRLAPLSPDMFQETLVESDEENSPESVIDLTQENSDKQSDRIHSPYLCEKSDEDVSMLECSPRKSLPKSPANTLANQPVASTSSRVDPSFVNDSVWDCYQGGIDDLNNCPSPPVNITIPSAILELTEIDDDPPAKLCNPHHVEDEFPDELDSIFPQNTEDFEPSPIRPIASTLSKPSGSCQVTDNNTPEPPRQAKKRKIDVTPLPDYQSMETPLLKQELVKYGLKPFKRSNAVKLLQHIYEELHPLVTDSESSFQDTPERPRVTADRHNKQPSPAKSSSYEESESGHSQEDEESLIVMELDREVGSSTQSSSPGVRSLPLKDRMKAFLQKRPDIYKSVLTYEPISFEYLFKEVRKERIRCKAQELLDWLDEECITCRMKNRNRPTTNRATETDDPNITPPEKVVSTTPNKKQPKARRVAKKLIT